MFFLGLGRAEASKGRVISESEHQGEDHTSFPESFNEIFVMLLSIFLTDKVLFFPHFDFIRRFIIGSRLHIYMYIIPWHTVFSADSCPLLSASRRTKLRYRFFSVLVMLTIRCLIS